MCLALTPRDWLLWPFAACQRYNSGTTSTTVFGTFPHFQPKLVSSTPVCPQEAQAARMMFRPSPNPH